MMGFFTEWLQSWGDDYCVAEEIRSSRKERGMSNSRRLPARFILMFLFVLVAAQAPSGQRSAQTALARARSLKCVFSVMATSTWKGGEPVAEIKPAKLSMDFDTIEAQESTAHYGGGDVNLVPADIIAQQSGGSLHLMQTSRSGAVYLTTVLPSASRDGKLKAVHARHEYTEVSLPGYTSRPEQYYGECEAQP
jgi:hypothetical protein